MQKEIWAKCSLLPSHYEVSNLGNVRYWKDGAPKRKSTRLSYDGYVVLRFLVNAKRIERRLSRVVATAFIKNPDNLPEVNHIDRCKVNNSIYNLEWVTEEENMNHYVRSRGVVCAYTLYGELVSEYNSVKEASIAVGVSKHSIYFCLYGKQKKAGGYIWKLIKK